MSKFFPIKTQTACQLKWSWSTLYLNSGQTASCHRTGWSDLTQENFLDFHNTDLKISDRQSMLSGVWPEKSCQYCRNIEQSGGFSDRMRHQTIPDLSPEILYQDPTAVKIDPTIVEVFFNNTCNLGCLYCIPDLSSTINSENQRYGEFDRAGVTLVPYKGQFKNFAPLFWQWFESGFSKLRRFHVLGGEPFLQKEWDRLLDMIEKHPNPGCELNVVTNLMVPTAVLQKYIDQFRRLLKDRALKRIDITCSIDCWGDAQEYVRYGIDLDHWQKNFLLLKSNRWLTVNINQTISVLTIKTMPDLLENLIEWRKERPIGHWFSGVSPGPAYLKPNILGDEFREDFDKILDLMPTETDEDRTAIDYMRGIKKQSTSTGPLPNDIRDLFIFLEEKDRRRGTSWKNVFPWLIEFEEKYVV